MRKLLASFTALFIIVFALTGCTKEPETSNAQTFDALVTTEQANTDSTYAARAYIESLFLNNRALFECCYPSGFLDRLNESAGVDVYETYRSVFVISGTFLGTSAPDYRIVAVENGFDEGYMRSRIGSVTCTDYSDIGVIKIQKVKVYFQYDSGVLNTDFYIITYEVNGSWYVLESVNGQWEF